MKTTNIKKYVCLCGKEFLKSQSLNAHYSHCIIHRSGKLPITNRGGGGWSKGMTKENNEGVKKMSSTLSITRTGKKHSEKTKTILSNKRIMFLEENPNSNVKWFIVNNGIRDIKVQGKWELTIANWLNSNNIKWDRIRIKYDGHRTYTPDFWLPEFNFFIEVKGWLRNEDIIKMNKVVMENSIDLRILNKELYNKLDTITFDDLIKWQI